MERLVCLLVGYCFGLFLTAELVARFRQPAAARQNWEVKPGHGEHCREPRRAGAPGLAGGRGQDGGSLPAALLVLFPELVRWPRSMQVWEPLWDTTFPCGGGSAVEREWQ